MTDRYTNAEWAAQIAETQKAVVRQDKAWPVPAAGSREFAQTIDHTLLKLDATAAQIDALCAEARQEGFKSVCVRLPFVARCVSNLRGSSVVVACVVGFHEGTYDTYAKLQEAQEAVKAGASELDIVLNHSILTSAPTPSPKSASSTPPPAPSHKQTLSDATTESITASNSSTPPTSGPYSVPSNDSNTTTTTHPAQPPNYSAIFTELAALRTLCPAPTLLKLILETSALTPAQILAATHLAAAARFDFVKTSTGFAGRGATEADVLLMRAACDVLGQRAARGMQVKASGGIRSLEGAVAMLRAGAGRLGTSSGVWIMQEGRRVVAEKETGRPGGGVTRLYTGDSVGGY
ncbi:aldolase [Cenococcum geophilum 1.58]|uniref:aldolase n=1 Tax=Cenococcum geophilum 1.58 TaxID=794803 RepID=UPI00358F336E|nr:aldolase [Cenococcum geophilum 1.58]